MRQSHDDVGRKAGLLPGLLAVAGLLALSACGNIYEGVGPKTSVPSISGGGPNDTGTYPNLNIRPVAATAQMSPQQQAAADSGLKSSAAAAKAGASTKTMSAADKARLIQLAKDKGETVRKQIDGE